MPLFSWDYDQLPRRVRGQTCEFRWGGRGSSQHGAVSFRTCRGWRLPVIDRWDSMEWGNLQFRWGIVHSAFIIIWNRDSLLYGVRIESVDMRRYRTIYLHAKGFVPLQLGKHSEDEETSTWIQERTSNTEGFLPTLCLSEWLFSHTQNRKRCENFLNLVSTTSTSIWEIHMGRFIPPDASSLHG
jgi:hypothetical protein